MDNKFKTAAKYSCRSVCDYNTVWTFEVVSRTDKSVTLREVVNGVPSNKTVTKRVKLFQGVESVFPLGSYSMAPILRAA